MIPTRKVKVPIHKSGLVPFDSRRVLPHRSNTFAPALPFYSTPEWKRLKSEIIRERGYQCEDVNCQTPHRGAKGWILADHVVEIKDGGAPLERANILLRCPACHSRKTHTVRKARSANVSPPEETMARTLSVRREKRYTVA